ncbi:molybdenum cofactor guanylyltransferase [Clostridiaceae bacterium M8S5]|nr:molybdenum cofactor guanylyltransferase [Clostridiaceae bacterium M8S5]
MSDDFGTCVILAGGKSKRMGFDKQTLKINNVRLLDTISSKLQDEFNDIIIITNKPNYNKNKNIRIYRDEIIGKGPLSGIHKGLKEAKSKYVYFIACDMPNINLKYIRFMKRRICSKDISACITKNGKWIEPLNSFYNVSILTQLEEHILKNSNSIHSFVKKIKCEYIEEKVARNYSNDLSMFINLNTKEDLNIYIHNAK